MATYYRQPRARASLELSNSGTGANYDGVVRANYSPLEGIVFSDEIIVDGETDRYGAGRGTEFVIDRAHMGVDGEGAEK